MMLVPIKRSLAERLVIKVQLTKEQLEQELAMRELQEQERIARFAEYNLSPQQTKAIRWLARGTKIESIGEKIGTSSKRGKNVIVDIKDKTDIHSKFGLAQLHWGEFPKYIATGSP